MGDPPVRARVDHGVVSVVGVEHFVISVEGPEEGHFEIGVALLVGLADGLVDLAIRLDLSVFDFNVGVVNRGVLGIHAVARFKRDAFEASSFVPVAKISLDVEVLHDSVFGTSSPLPSGGHRNQSHADEEFSQHRFYFIYDCVATA